MYTQNHNSFTAYIGHRRVYKFDRNVPGDKARAQREMTRETNAIVEATQARARATIGRELTSAELIRNRDIVKDARPLREKISTDMVGRAGQDRDPSENVYRARVDFLESELANRPPREHPGIKLRLEMAIKSANEFDVKLAETNARIALQNDPKMVDARIYSQSWIAILDGSADPAAQAWLEKYRHEIENLEKTGNVARYWEFNKAFEAERTAVIQGRADELARQSDELKIQAAIAIDTIERPDSSVDLLAQQSDALKAAIVKETV